MAWCLCQERRQRCFRSWSASASSPPSSSWRLSFGAERMPCLSWRSPTPSCGSPGHADDHGAFGMRAGAHLEPRRRKLETPRLVRFGAVNHHRDRLCASLPHRDQLAIGDDLHLAGVTHAAISASRRQSPAADIPVLQFGRKARRVQALDENRVASWRADDPRVAGNLRFADKRQELGASPCRWRV